MRPPLPVAVTALGVAALWGCAQIAGIQPLPIEDAGGGSGGSSGSGSGVAGSSSGGSSGSSSGSVSGSSSGSVAGSSSGGHVGGSSSGGSSSGSSSGGPSAFVGTWALSGTENSPCLSAPESYTASPVIVTGPNSNEITVTTAEGCNIIFTVSGRTATLNSGQQPCSSTSGGDLVSTQWNSGDLDLTSSTQVSVDLNFTSTDETEDVVCTVVLTATMTD